MNKSEQEYKMFQEFLKWKEENNNKNPFQENSESDDVNVNNKKPHYKKILLKSIFIIFILFFILLFVWFIYSFKIEELEKIFTPKTEQTQKSSTITKQRKKINYAELGAEAGEKDGTNDGLNKAPSKYKYSSKENENYKFYYRNRYDWYYKKANEFILKREIEGLPINKESFKDYTTKELGKLSHRTVSEMEEFPPIPDN